MKFGSFSLIRSFINPDNLRPQLVWIDGGNLLNISQFKIFNFPSLKPLDWKETTYSATIQIWIFIHKNYSKVLQKEFFCSFWSEQEDFRNKTVYILRVI